MTPANLGPVTAPPRTADARGGSDLRRRYRYVDLVRGFAAVAILVWHYRHFYYPEAGVRIRPAMVPSQPFFDVLRPIYQHGDAAVDLFWVLSGFVFAATYLVRPVGPREYFLKRFARLYPLHLATLVLVALLQVVSTAAVGHEQIYRHNDPPHFVMHLLMVQGWGFESGFSFNGPTWSVSVEIVIYAVFFVTIPLLRRSPLAGGVVGASIASALLGMGVSSLFVDCALFFHLGVVCWAVQRMSARLALGIGTVAICCAVVSRVMIRDDDLTPVEMALLFGGVMLAAAALDVLRPMRTTAFDWFGNATYSTYLLHVPIQIAALTAMQSLDIDAAEFAGHGVSLVAFVLVVFAVGVAVRPFEEWAKRRLSGTDRR